MKIIATRTIDELGRIILPFELRKKLGISSHDKMDVYIDTNGDVVLKKSPSRCVIRKNPCFS